ncbi:hypothetical protein ABQJ54_12780 [Rhodanobacter sp. Si-c]|uniref:DUF2756 domain-containing protein n=1 Tax=Rhodanobacter lycopersici TaxID=3162487 RepID=A0ABV3QFL6_9GAMM
MTIARLWGEKLHRSMPHWLLAGLLAFTGTAMAQTSPANARFQQSVRQQQVGDQLQKSQQQAQQRQNVANMQQQPLAQGAAARNQQDQANRAQQDLENARQQDLVNRYGDASALPSRQPAAATTGTSKKSQGH